MSLFSALIKYQKIRFPLVLLVPTTLTSVLGSAAILGTINWLLITLTFLVAIAFLFHLRAIDEIRDFRHDTMYHTERPVQKGIISIKQLKIARKIALVVFFGICAFYSLTSLIIAIGLFLYSSIAAKDFYVADRIRKHFFLYNFLNMLQLVGLQFVIYTLLRWNLSMSPIIWWHLAAIFLLSLLLEVMRKVKLPSEETAGKDTYSDHLGFKGSILFINIVMAATLVSLNSIRGIIGGSILFPAVIFMICIAASVLHSRVRKSASEKLLFLSVLVYYCTINLAIFTFTT